MKKEILTLEYVGENYWGNDVYKTKEGKLLVDASCGYGIMDLHTLSSNDIDGEPNIPLRHIPQYANMEIKITGRKNEPTKEEKFNYMMLSRLQSDCNYYLGNGGRYAPHLWAGDEQKQIEEMKKLWNGFSEDKKPEWLTWDQILEYENKMCKY